MSGPTKRRHLSYYFSLPVLAAIVFFLVAQLTTRQRTEIVAELADRVAHHEADDATAALRQLAAMPRPPIDVLVSAAASPDQEIAEEAQLLLSGLLRRWSRQIDNNQRLSTVSRQLAELAQALAANQGTFSSADHPWLAATARRILRLANRTPVDGSPLVAMHCDSVLESLAASETAANSLMARTLPAGPPIVAAVDVSAETPQGASSRKFVEPKLAAHADASAALGNENPLREPESSVPSDVRPNTGAVALFQSPWRGAWAHPVFRILPAMPIKAGPSAPAESAQQDQSTSIREKEIFTDTSSAVADDDSRQLLARWLIASGSNVFPLEEELTRRGFGRLSARLVRQLFSNDSAERLRLVDDVLTEPGVDARPWLILLADDPAADVRLLTVTIMATSDDPTLIEKAWQVAISDRDPRIAGLASRLRERRDSAQRR